MDELSNDEFLNDIYMKNFPSGFEFIVQTYKKDGIFYAVQSRYSVILEQLHIFVS